MNCSHPEIQAGFKNQFALKADDISERRAPNYVEWQSLPSQIGHSGRSNAFAVDPDLEKYLAASNQHAVQPTDYTGSCFDHGHQVLSADRSDIITLNGTTSYISDCGPDL